MLLINIIHDKKQGVYKIMSCAVAVKSGDIVFVGADSQTNNGNIKRTLTENQSKIWKTDDIIFAHSGPTVDHNIISTSDKIIDGSA